MHREENLTSKGRNALSTALGNALQPQSNITRCCAVPLHASKILAKHRVPCEVLDLFELMQQLHIASRCHIPSLQVWGYAISLAGRSRPKWDRQETID